MTDPNNPKKNKNSQAKLDANNRYAAKNYDRISVVIPKGQKEIIADHAKKQGESINSYVTGAITERMKREDSSAD